MALASLCTIRTITEAEMAILAETKRLLNPFIVHEGLRKGCEQRLKRQWDYSASNNQHACEL
jgi:hypothetical protein